MESPVLDQNQAAAPQIEAFYRRAIRAGVLRAGDRLPPIREAAVRMQVPRVAVQDAYRRLAMDGLVTATVGRGTVVNGESDLAGPFSSRARATFDHVRGLALADPPPPQKIVADFSSAHPDEAHFPVHEFTESLRRVLATHGSDLLCYRDPNGDPQLRSLLAGRVGAAESPGTEDEILVTSGAQQGLDLVVRTFTRPGDAVAVSVPTYHHFIGLLRSHELQLVPLRGGHPDTLLQDLRRAIELPNLRLVYVMPTFENPTGRTMDLDVRRQLTAILAPTRLPVLEDEFDLELRFAGEDLPSLRSLDQRDLTVTVRTFSKGLFPGARLGWLHAPTSLLGPMAAMKRYVDLETSPLLQAALVDCLERGIVDRHVAALRQRLRAAHVAAQSVLQRVMPEPIGWTRPEGGFSVWLETAPLDDLVLARTAAERGVLISPASMFYPEGSRPSGARVSLSRVPLAAVEAGITVLGECAHDLLHRTQLRSGSPTFV